MPTPPRTGEREATCGNCGGTHATRDCPNPLLDDARRKCFNCGKEGHRAKYCKKTDRRKQQHGGRALLVGAPRDHFLGVVALDSFSLSRSPSVTSRGVSPDLRHGARRRQSWPGRRSRTARRATQHANAQAHRAIVPLTYSPDHILVLIHILSRRGRMVQAQRRVRRNQWRRFRP